LEKCSRIPRLQDGAVSVAVCWLVGGIALVVNPTQAVQLDAKGGGRRRLNGIVDSDEGSISSGRSRMEGWMEGRMDG